MKRAVILAALVVFVGVPLAQANICAMDAVPAATLLFPFVVYDYTLEPAMFTDPPVERANTILSITNMSDQAQVLRACVWTDFGIEIFNFNILLTGYDMVRFSMHDILADGQLPVTFNSHHQELEGVISKGPVSEESVLNGAWIDGLMPAPQATNTLGPRCATSDPQYPGQYVTPIPAGVLDLFQQWLQSSQTASRWHSDDCTRPFSGTSGTSSWFVNRDSNDHTWMYITVDVVETCNATFPDEAGYWIPGTAGGDARYDNVLTGHVTWEFPPFTKTTGQAVHVEADENLDRVATEGNLFFPSSFYARYSNVNDVISDYREPLPTAWAMPYDFSDGSGQTSVVAWKGSTYWSTIYDLDFEPFNENPYDMMTSNCHAYTYYVWDEDENVLGSSPGIRPNLIPLVTQEVSIDNFEIVDTSGWILFVFPHSNYPEFGDPVQPDNYQTWMGSFLDHGPTRAFSEANPVANYNCYSDQGLPALGTNYPYVDPTTGGYTVSPCTVYDYCFLKGDEGGQNDQGAR